MDELEHRCRELTMQIEETAKTGVGIPLNEISSRMGLSLDETIAAIKSLEHDGRAYAAWTGNTPVVLTPKGKAWLDRSRMPRLIRWLYYPVASNVLMLIGVVVALLFGILATVLTLLKN